MSSLLSRSLPALAALLTACSTAAPPPQRPVAPAAPPKDDGGTSKGAAKGGDEHAAALEQLKVAPLDGRVDKQGSVRIPLPDAPSWTRVRFLTLKSLVGFRYGKDHHAVVAGMVTHVPDNREQGACPRSVEVWAEPFIKAFEVELSHEPPEAFAWKTKPAAAGAPEVVSIVDVDPIHAKTATVLMRESYAAAYATYPVWDNACLVVGVAVPENGEPARAAAVRDRFVKDVFPHVDVLTDKEPPERY